jgi:hypothetical protein
MTCSPFLSTFTEKWFSFEFLTSMMTLSFYALIGFAGARFKQLPELGVVLQKLVL